MGAAWCCPTEIRGFIGTGALALFEDEEGIAEVSSSDDLTGFLSPIYYPYL